MSAKEVPLNLPTSDDLFSTQAERDDAKREKVLEIPLTEIDPFPDHPFQVRDDEDMVNMVESIAKFGVLSPAVARVKEDGRYELVSGYRRKHAAELAGRETLPLIVRNMTRDEAVIAMVDANLQREHILPSEKAFSYKMKHDAIKRQGKRSDLTSSQFGTKLQSKRSLDLVGEETGDSRNTVYRYIRLTELLPELLDLVDENKIGLSPALSLSYISKPEQVELFKAMEYADCTPSHAQAIKLRKFSEGGKLTTEVIESIMSEFPQKQEEMASRLNEEMEVVNGVQKSNRTKQGKVSNCCIQVLRFGAA